MKSRTGTGSASSSSPCSLTVSFAPTIVYGMCYKKDSYYYSSMDTFSNVPGRGMAILADVTTSFVAKEWMTSDSENCYVKKSSDGKTIYWYGSGSYPERALNYNGSVYYFLAIA